MPHIPLKNLKLEVPNFTFKTVNTSVTRPITDHPPIIQNTLWGAIGTINILNPGSPLAPPALVNGVTSLPKDGKAQMEHMAEYIYDMFQKGVGMLALQEVPAPGTANFGFLINKLKSLDKASKLIDVDSLATQWSKTGTHEFGTSLLYNPKMFTVSGSPTLQLNNRAAVYNVTAADGASIPVANVHGDFKAQQATANFYANFDGFCLGDLNIPSSSMCPGIQPQALQSIVSPSLQINNRPCQINTVDAVQDTYSRKVNPGFTPNLNGISNPVSSYRAPEEDKGVYFNLW
ncbi:hypothetical protein [Legionella hackeliae]|uniref:Uncharacterized protein n=1 Tax=Legionella hackeliae TaxID=449 RepID=A0A0A8UWN2_LEGHA|nr:hypothetical protein [Legionella hackeliae]KTD15490.1 hypothetical protein Lhac_0332 [Legionella hackeliae]CEK11139.1 conserved protein of unknown function [Legionella hackeliae]STX47897.1 Uncharacterised protein [Legionella hackeliae]